MAFNKKIVCTILAIVTVFSLSVQAAERIYLTASVTDPNGAFIEGATVKLVKAGIATNTNAVGVFVLTTDAVANSISREKTLGPRLVGNTLYFTIGATSEHVQIHVCDLTGKFVVSAYEGSLSHGMWAIKPFNHNLPAKMYIIRVKLGNRVSVLKMPLVDKNRISAYFGAAGNQNENTGISLKKAVDYVDTVLVSKTGFKSDTLPILKYVDTLADFVLDSIPPMVEMGILSNRTTYNVDPVWKFPDVWGGSVAIDSTDTVKADRHDGGKYAWKITCAWDGAGWDMADLREGGVDLTRYTGGTLHLWLKGNAAGLTVGIIWHVVTGPAAGTNVGAYVLASHYGYVNNGSWYEINAPLADFIAQGADLSRIKGYAVFFASSSWTDPLGPTVANTWYIPNDITWVPKP